MGEVKRAQELRVDVLFSVQKLRESHETIQRLTSQMQEMQEQMNSMNDWRNSRSGIESQRESVLRSQSTSSDSKFSFHAEPRQTLATLTHGIRLDHRKTFLVINFLHLNRPKIIIKEFIILRHQVLQDRFQCILVQALLSQEMKIELGARFQCRHLQEGRRPSVHYYRWRFGQQRQQRSELQFDKFPTTASFLCWKIRFKS